VRRQTGDGRTHAPSTALQCKTRSCSGISRPLFHMAYTPLPSPCAGDAPQVAHVPFVASCVPDMPGVAPHMQRIPRRASARHKTYGRQDRP
jgi:hypothetical protein